MVRLRKAGASPCQADDVAEPCGRCGWARQPRGLVAGRMRLL